MFFLLAICVALPMLAAFIAVAGQALFAMLEPGSLYLNHAIKVEPEVKLFEVDEFLPRARSAAVGSVRALGEEGFEQQASFWIEHSKQEMLYVVVMRHPVTHDRALICSGYSHFQYVDLKESYIEMRSERADGRCVRTLNSAALTPFGAEPHAIETFVSPSLEPRALLQAHRFICDQQIARAREENPPEEALDYLLRLAREEREGWKARGLIVLDEGRGVFRLTYKGACLMSWGQLWPVSGVRRDRIASAASRRLGGAASTCSRDRLKV